MVMGNLDHADYIFSDTTSECSTGVMTNFAIFHMSVIIKNSAVKYVITLRKHIVGYSFNT